MINIQDTLQEPPLSVGEMVAQDYRKAEVFKKFGIDFCCGGKQSLEQTCLKKGIDLARVEAALQDLERIKSSHDFNSFELDFLVDYIVNVHHKYVKAALPLLDQFSAKVARVHGAAHPEVIKIATEYEAVANELTNHMHKEEMVLFPYIKRIVEAKRNGETLPRPNFGSITNPIQMMEMEHEVAGDSLRTIAELSNNYQPPAEACHTYSVLFAKLQEFENDLHQHIHLENNILFPKAIQLEAEMFQAQEN